MRRDLQAAPRLSVARVEEDRALNPKVSGREKGLCHYTAAAGEGGVHSTVKTMEPNLWLTLPYVLAGRNVGVQKGAIRRILTKKARAQHGQNP